MVLSSTILDFYPRPPRGGRHTKSRYAGNTVIFLSTPSARRATKSLCDFMLKTCYFYPRPPRGGRLPCSVGRRLCRIDFYPRPPRGGRHEQTYVYQVLYDFYPRPPRGGRLEVKNKWDNDVEFLSTPSARRATSGCTGRQRHDYRFLSTPSARRATAGIL